jgi:hypothetical protein
MQNRAWVVTGETVETEIMNINFRQYGAGRNSENLFVAWGGESSPVTFVMHRHRPHPASDTKQSSPAKNETHFKSKHRGQHE